MDTCTHKENNTNKSVKSNICNYTSVRKDIIQHQPLQVQLEWNHNDSHLLLIINKGEYNQRPDVKSSFGWVLSYTSLAKIEGMRDKLSLSLVTRSPYLGKALWTQRRLLQLQSLDIFLSAQVLPLESELLELACSRHGDKLL